jgi:hypothetical protein
MKQRDKRRMASPRGLHQVSEINGLAKSGTPFLPTGSLGFLPEVSHQLVACGQQRREMRPGRELPGSLASITVTPVIHHFCKMAVAWRVGYAFYKACRRFSYSWNLILSLACGTS